MPDPRPTPSRSAASVRGADSQCRGIGPSVTPASPSGRGGWSTPPADAPVARPVVREADGYAVRSAITQAATEAVTQDAAERATLATRPMATDDSAPSAPASADLTRLLDHLRTVVAGYVCDRRRAGAPIERVLPEVKGLVRAAVAHEGWHEPAAALMRHVVGWTIAAYYDAPAQPRPQAQETPHVAGRR